MAHRYGLSRVNKRFVKEEKIVREEEKDGDNLYPPLSSTGNDLLPDPEHLSQRRGYYE